MTQQKQDAILKALGLRADQLGPSHTLGEPDNESAEGFVKEAILSVAILISSPTADFFSESCSPAKSVGVELASGTNDARGTWRIRTADDTPFLSARTLSGVELAPGTAPSETVCFLPDDPSTVLVNESVRAIVVTRENHEGVFIDFDSREVRAVWPPPIELRGFTDIEASAAEWAAERNDAWLEEECRSRASTGDPYDVAASVAIFERAAEINDADVNALERFLAGESGDEIMQPSRRWLQALRESDIQTIADLALAEAGQWHDRLPSLTEQPEFFEKAYLEDLRRFLYARDELEGICRLLSERGAHRALREALRNLDGEAKSFVASLPRGIFAGDERLLRIAVDPAAWWAEPAFPS